MSNTSIDGALADFKRVQRALRTSTASRWRDLDISMQQLRAIYVLRDEEIATVGRLAELFGIGLPAASILADRLVRAGYVERNEDPADRRRVQLTLTRAGVHLVTELQEGSHLLIRRWMSRLSPEDLAALSRGWRALAESASRIGQPFEKTAVRLQSRLASPLKQRPQRRASIEPSSRSLPG